MAIDTIFIMTVSIIAIFFLLFMFSTKIPGVGKEVYCKTFFHLASSKVFPEPVRQSQDYCKQENKDPAIITQASPRVFTRSTLAGGATAQKIQGAGSLAIGLPEDAVVKRSNLTFFTRSTLTWLDIDVSDDGTIESSLIDPPIAEKFSIADPLISDELSAAIATAPKPCPIGECSATIAITADGNITLAGIDIDYSSCGITDTIIAQLQLCEQKTRDSGVNVICGEVAISQNCQAVQADEIAVADRLKKDNLCEQLSIERLGCGSGEKVDWNLTQLNPGENILIEYRASTKSVRAS